MAVDFQILGSSSNGNCALLRTATSKILIDAGFSAKRIAGLLEAIGESLDHIDAVFITHEHGDHAQGIRGLARRADLPIYANRDTADAIQAKLTKRANWQIFQTGSSFRFRDLEIRAFSLPHDAYDPVGFTFHWGEDGDLFSPPSSLAWVTDLGYAPSHVMEHVSEVEILVLEANYDEALLEKDEKRPWATKQRIRGRHGHLSNEAAYEIVQKLKNQPNLRKVYLAHLSKDCNTTELVQNKFAAIAEHSTNLAVYIVDPTQGLQSITSQLMTSDFKATV